MTPEEIKRDRMTDTPKEGDLQVWWILNYPRSDMFHVPVSSAEEGAKLLTILAEYDAYQSIVTGNDYCNAGGLSGFEGGEWCDWYDEETGEDDPIIKHPQPSLGWCARLP